MYGIAFVFTDIYYANGSKTKYDYSLSRTCFGNTKTFRLKRLLTTRNTGQDILQDLNYTYDAVGNITEQIDNAQQTFYYNNSVIEPKGQYEYDALYRLVKATGRELNSLALPTHSDFANNIGLPNTAANAMQNYTHNYSYDELGNMQRVNSEGNWTRDYFYNSHNNYLQGHATGVAEYTYDAHGNMLSMPHLQALHWDYKDWLTQVELDANGNKAWYVYNAGGERVRKIVEKRNIKEERLYFGDYEIYRKFVSGILETERTTIAISDDKAKIATIDRLTVDQSSLIENPTAVVRYQLDNHLGSASLELDETADIISYEEYHPFGTTSYRSGRTETETSLKRYKYVGKERDEETGLYYYGFRYYAAWICKFVSVDPLQFDYPHYTPFQYAGNKPISYIDLDGLEEAKLNDLYKRPTVKIDNTYFDKKQPKNIVDGKNYSRVGQGALGVFNIVSGLSLVVTGAGLAIASSASVVGALAGISIMLAGFSQMAIGTAQTVDAMASREKHIPDVSGPTELIGAKLTEKTGNPIYQAGGAGVDLLSSVGFGATKAIPVVSNLKNIAHIGIPQDLNKTIEFSRNTIEIGNDLNTIISNSKNVIDFNAEVPNKGISDNNDTIISINQNEQYHTIYPGETLTSIAKYYNTTIEEIVRLNSIKNPNVIYAGEEIKVFENRTVDIINLNNQ